jgi:hypothetical protein
MKRSSPRLRASRAAGAKIHAAELPAPGEIDDRVDDEFPLRIAPADDRPHLHREVYRHERPARKVVFEVDAVEEVLLRRIRRDELGAELEIVRQELALFVHRPRDIEAELEPRRHAVGEFGGAIEGMVVDQGARICRLGQPFDRVVEVLLHRELADLVDLGGVDLDLVYGVGGRDRQQGASQGQGRQQRQCLPPNHFIPQHPPPGAALEMF